MGPSEAADTVPLVLMAGNPNTGKTSLFNQISGHRGRVGNYPGVTVERRHATVQLAQTTIELADLPGCYSLTARSAEEQIAIAAVVGTPNHPPPDLVVLVIDATQLIRNLYLLVQLLELEAQCVVALNMVDETGDAAPDPASITEVFGVPCVITNGRTGEGIDALGRAIVDALGSGIHPAPVIPYPPKLIADIDAVIPALPAEWSTGGPRDRALALWALNSIGEGDELIGIDAGLRRVVEERATAARNTQRDIDTEAISARYIWLDDHQGALKPPPPSRTSTDRVDAILLHPVWGFAAFLGLMLVLFQSLFAGADPMIGMIEDSFAWVSQLATAHLPAGFLTDLLTEGLIAGVGSVVVFLPQILLLFLLIGIMEDSGYMARAAFLMDRIMRAIGLHGRAFVPMMSGYACAVPAVMATRTMERRRDRFLTMMVIPLMSCSARLPVYTLVIAALFPPSTLFGVLPVQGLLMVAMYLFSTAVALLAAAVLARTVLKGQRIPLLMELPPYRMPTVALVLRRMWERSRLFLSEAGGVILVCTVVLWGMLSFPQVEAPAPGAPPQDIATWQATSLEQSFGGQVGKAIEPVIRPLGFDWKIGVGLIGAFAAREVFVSTMGLVYGVGDGADEENLPLRTHMKAEVHADGSPVYTPLAGLSLMVFFALACQCMSTLAVVKRETGGYAWPAFMFIYMTGLAWTASFVVYQGGKLLGFG
jgi:ferrous iron transport protein B